MPVILAAPGSGKSYSVKQNPGWIDMDELYSDVHNMAWHVDERANRRSLS